MHVATDSCLPVTLNEIWKSGEQYFEVIRFTSYYWIS